MYYKITLEEQNNDWIYVLTLKKNVPFSTQQANQLADKQLSAEDKHGIRHYVLFKDEKIIQIQLHQALQIFPFINPENPSSLQMPEVQSLMFGNPPMPSLLIIFKEFRVEKLIGYFLTPNVSLVFDGAELARLYITDVYSVIADLG